MECWNTGIFFLIDPAGIEGTKAFRGTGWLIVLRPFDKAQGPLRSATG
ncbi:MAG: hypothetical protein ABIJ40_14820 [Bacteroidota bacterium]|nr:hypothetical protein [Bacteroidota bacterium]